MTAKGKGKSKAKNEGMAMLAEALAGIKKNMRNPDNMDISEIAGLVVEQRQRLRAAKDRAITFPVRGIDVEAWYKFKFICLSQGISANAKLLAMIYREVEWEGGGRDDAEE